MTRRAGLVVGSALAIAGLAAAALLAGGASATRDGAPADGSYYLARGDPRMCPSPMCGGLFVRLVNRSRAICGDGTRQLGCYVASADLGKLRVSEKRREELAGLLSSGRALARGALVRGRVEGFPQLDTLVVSEVWPASSSSHPPTGVFRRLRDNGVRCVAAPCFSIDASRLNPASAVRPATVSTVEGIGRGATAAEVRRAMRLLATTGLIAAGRIVAVPNAGPAGSGRAFVVTQFYLRAA